MSRLEKDRSPPYAQAHERVRRTADTAATLNSRVTKGLADAKGRPLLRRTDQILPMTMEQEVYTNTRASSAVQSHHRGSAPRLSGQALNDARIEQDGDGPDNDQAAQDECERRGFGAEETRKARAEAKDRQKDVVRAKNGRIQDWRYPALNEVQSITVLKYFDPVSKLEPSPGFIKSITWKCRCCHRTFTAAPGITTNLLGHLNAKPGRGPCPDRDNPLTKGVEPWIPSWAKDDESARVPEPAKG
ncbi:unnamed protein product, partial [Tilletia laevis]